MVTPVCLPSLKFKLRCYCGKYGSSCLLYAQSSMVELLEPLRVKHTVPLPGTKLINVAIKQTSAIC